MKRKPVQSYICPRPKQVPPIEVPTADPYDVFGQMSEDNTRTFASELMKTNGPRADLSGVGAELFDHMKSSNLWYDKDTGGFVQRPNAVDSLSSPMSEALARLNAPQEVRPNPVASNRGPLGYGALTLAQVQTMFPGRQA